MKVNRPFVFKAVAVILLLGLAGSADAQTATVEQLPGPTSSPVRVETRPLDVRIKDITDIEGVRTHVLTGFGLVTGLDGTGSNDEQTRRIALNILENSGGYVPADFRDTFLTSFKSTNLSIVTVRAELPPFAFEGQKIDVTVSVFDSATSLQGGKLSLLTPLYGLDRQVYALASGTILVGGFSASGQSANIQKNNVTNGVIPLGGHVEKTLCQPDLGAEGFVDFHVRNQDRMTAVRVAEAINQKFPQKAQIVGNQAIRVWVPVRQTQSETEKFLSEIQELRVVPDSRAQIIVNRNSGTIVITENATMRPVITSVGNLTIATTETPQVSQPAPFAGGDTTVTPQTNIQVNEDQASLRLLPGARSLRDLVESLNSLGFTAREMIDVLSTIKASGALQAELIVQ